MSSAAKIAANAANAQSSTGPRTEEGKVVCSRNAITLGLYTAADFIRPGEESIYAAFREDLLNELAPQGILENTLVDEIRRATWRLRRCGEVEASLAEPWKPGAAIRDPMETPHPSAEKAQKSVDRARSQAHRLLHKCTSELRKLQTSRQSGQNVRFTNQTQAAGPSVGKPADSGLETARNAQCPCKSGLKYKRCCGKAGGLTSPLPARTENEAPALLHAA